MKDQIYNLRERKEKWTESARSPRARRKVTVETKSLTSIAKAKTAENPMSRGAENQNQNGDATKDD